MFQQCFYSGSAAFQKYFGSDTAVFQFSRTAFEQYCASSNETGPHISFTMGTVHI